jgi:hypothetical protein
MKGFTQTENLDRNLSSAGEPHRWKGTLQRYPSVDSPNVSTWPEADWRHSCVLVSPLMERKPTPRDSAPPLWQGIDRTLHAIRLIQVGPLNEFVFRFNRRFWPIVNFDSVLKIAARVDTPTYTLYTEKALEQLRADGYEVRPEDVARLSPLQTHHVNVLGRYSFSLAEQVANGGMRPLRNPDDDDGWPLA